MPRRLLLALALVTACTRGTTDAPPPLDTPPAEPPPVAAEVAPEPTPEPEPEPPPPPAPTLDLAATALEAGGLTTFLTAVDIAGLRDRLTGPGPLTVFAPSDAAFAALPKAELDRLLKNKKKLAALLGHHVVVGAAVPGAELPTQTTPLRTAAGTDLTPSTLAAPSRPDLAASNGVLHIIDVVLQPPKPGAKPPADKPQEPAKKSQEPAKK
jgi:hypothetical protein